MDSEQPSFIPQHVTPSAMSDAAKRMAEDLAIAQAAREAGMVDEQGRFRKILGTLPVTADGCVVGNGAEVFVCGCNGHPPTPFTVFTSNDVTASSTGEAYVWWGGWDNGAEYIKDCYSSEEAARSAAEAAKGGGDGH